MEKKLVLKNRYFNLLLGLNLLGVVGCLVGGINATLPMSIMIAVNTFILVKFGGIND